MKRFLSLILTLLCVESCSYLDRDGLGKDIEETRPEVFHDMIVLGDKLDDPYTVENVEAALAEVYPTKAGRVVIKATDLYVRFLPSDDSDYELLESMGVNMTDHPLDYEIVKEGDYYHDPSLVEREAFRLTGNSGMLPLETKGDGSARTPSGTIRVVDDRHENGMPEGLAGVKVSCNSFVKFAHAYTDVDGNYEMDKPFTSDVRYRIVFQNKTGFAIGLNKVLVPASTSTLGKNGPEGVSITIDKTSDRKLFTRSVVNNAAYDYFFRYGENGKEITAPPANLCFWIFQPLEQSGAMMLQQGGMIDDTFIGKFLGDYADLAKMFLPDITLGVKGLDEYSSIYSLAVHELAHASHFSQAGKQHWNKYADYIMKSFLKTGGVLYGTGAGENSGYCEIGEMWAYYMQNRLFKDRYGEDRTTFGTSYWFRPHILLYMDERGLGRREIFKALDPKTCSRQILQNKLENLYPDYDMVIRQAFERY